jgi:hypothetical protein
MTCVSAYLRATPFQPLNQLADFHENWYELYAIEGHPKAILSNFLQYTLTAWRAFKYVRLERQ